MEWGTGYVCGKSVPLSEFLCVSVSVSTSVFPVPAPPPSPHPSSPSWGFWSPDPHSAGAGESLSPRGAGVRRRLQRAQLDVRGGGGGGARGKAWRRGVWAWGQSPGSGSLGTPAPQARREGGRREMCPEFRSRRPVRSPPWRWGHGETPECPRPSLGGSPRGRVWRRCQRWPQTPRAFAFEHCSPHHRAAVPMLALTALGTHALGDSTPGKAPAP